MSVRTLLYLSISLFNVWASYDYFNEGETWQATLSAFLAAIMMFFAYRFHTDIWGIEEHDKIFTIRKNGKIHFQGRRMDIVTVTRHNGRYGLKPLKGRTIYVPKKAANEALLKLVGETAS